MKILDKLLNNKQKLDPNMKKKDLKKLKQQELTKARSDVGSISRRDRNIKITDKEWEAIQAGAIHENVLIKILNNSDPDSLREKATPRASKSLSQVKVDRIKAMANSNYTLNEIADKLAVSPSTVSQYLKGEK